MAPDSIEILSRRLRRQILWLILVQQPEVAALAMAAQDALHQRQSEHPFVKQFAWRSLLMTAADRATRTVLRLIK
ncbi:MAG: hypothetical protein GXP38_13270 [Chloroflexi bacterium]|nr:hypothetical protein [Chloroflexota bacterium]